MSVRSSRADAESAVVAPPAAIRGCLDVCTGDIISGWAWDSAHPQMRLAVDILVDGNTVARVTAQQYREDLKESGIGDGRHAFEYLPSPPIHTRHHKIVIVAVEADMRLPRSEAAAPFPHGTIPLPPDDMIYLVAGH